MNEKTNKVGSVAPRGPSENVGSSDPLAPSAQDAPAASSTPRSLKDRQDSLDEAAKLCGDLRNSIEAIGAFAITGHVDVVRQHYTLFVDRAKNLHALLKDQIDNLPEL